MLSKIVCSGVGGQGVLTLGNILAEAAASRGLYVTWVPEYGAEMRGGSASCKVKVSDEPIVSPFMNDVDILVALHTKAIEGFSQKVEKGGAIVVDSDILHDVSVPEGVHLVSVPATTLAEKIGNPRGMSVIMVGAVIAYSDLFPLDVAVDAVTSYFEAKHIPAEANKAAFLEGYHFVKSM